ncbi:hypothetical protein TrVFT333_008603 [Trichoderma virens FT-333]|nr:hypothetical protein TrVFT333_008603 [Trichoderma virens FT-333]
MAPSLPPALQQSLDETRVEYVRLGASGLRVSVPILGAMSFGSSQWLPWVLDEDDSIEILKAAFDRGLNTWDTADMYSNGISEETIGKALKKHSLSRGALFKAVDASLQRLGTDYIDLYMIHRCDPFTPVEETMRALHDLVSSGKIRYIGASSMWATQFAHMQSVAEKNGWTKFISMQNYYNLCYREEEREMNRYCNETGVGIMPWSPNFGGKLARPLGDATSLRAQMPSPTGNSLTKADEEIIHRVEQLAARKDWKMSQVALAWLRSKGAVPIVGLNSLSRLEEACDLRGKELTAEEIEFLEEPYEPKNVVGHA